MGQEDRCCRVTLTTSQYTVQYKIFIKPNVSNTLTLLTCTPQLCAKKPKKKKKILQTFYNV